MTVNDPEPRDGDALHTLQHAPEKFAAGFFVGTSDVLRAYQAAYHANLEKLHGMGIADDEQAVMVHMYYNKQIPSPPVHLYKRGWQGALKWLSYEE